MDFLRELRLVFVFIGCTRLAGSDYPMDTKFLTLSAFHTIATLLPQIGFLIIEFAVFLIDDALPVLRRDAVDLGPGHAAHDLNPIASVHGIGIPCDYASRSLGDARLREQPLDGGRVLRMEDPHDLGTCEHAVEPRRDGARLDEFERGRASNALCFSIASAASPAKAAPMSESLSAPVLTLDPSFPKKSGEPKFTC